MRPRRPALQDPPRGVFRPSSFAFRQLCTSFCNGALPTPLPSGLCSTPLGTSHPPLPTALYFQSLTAIKFCNSFLLITIQNAPGVCTPSTLPTFKYYLNSLLWSSAPHARSTSARLTPNGKRATSNAPPFTTHSYRCADNRGVPQCPSTGKQSRFLRCLIRRADNRVSAKALVGTRQAV